MKPKVVKKSSRGFTIIELAIAIIVIAILISGIVVGTRSLTSGARADNLTEFISSYEATMKQAKMECSNQLSQIASDSGNATNLTNDLHNCGVLTPSESLPSTYQGGTITYITNNITSNGQYGIQINGLDSALVTKIMNQLNQKYPNACTSSANQINCTFGT